MERQDRAILYFVLFSCIHTRSFVDEIIMNLEYDLEVEVYSWGQYPSTCLWHPGIKHARTPRKIQDYDPIFDISTFKILRSRFISVVCDFKGRVYSFGEKATGLLADTSKPLLVSPLKDQKIIEVCGYGDNLSTHTLFLSCFGSVYGVGDNEFGQAIGKKHWGAYRGRIETPEEISNLSPMAHVACGFQFSVCIAADGGRIYCFGRGHSGQLGNELKVSSIKPVRVVGPIRDEEVILSICCGHMSSIVLSQSKSRNGRVWGWGDGSCGNLGLGTTQDCALPMLLLYFVENAISIRQISCGVGHCGAISCENQAFVW